MGEVTTPVFPMTRFSPWNLINHERAMTKPMRGTEKWPMNIQNSTWVGRDDPHHRTPRRFCQFYNPATVNPYVALAARGPWMSHPMALLSTTTVATACLERAMVPIRSLNPCRQLGDGQRHDCFLFRSVLMSVCERIGTYPGSCPFEKFICMNSGSESVMSACE